MKELITYTRADTNFKKQNKIFIKATSHENPRPSCSLIAYLNKKKNRKKIRRLDF